MVKGILCKQITKEAQKYISHIKSISISLTSNLALDEITFCLALKHNVKIRTYFG